MAFQDLDENFKKIALKPIQTDAKKEEDLIKEEPPTDENHYEKQFQKSNAVSGLLSIFQEKLKNKDNKETSDSEFETVVFSTRNVNTTTTHESVSSEKEVSSEQIQDLLKSKSKNKIDVGIDPETTSYEQRVSENIESINSSEQQTFVVNSPTNRYEETKDYVDPNQNIKIFHQENENVKIQRYEDTKDSVNPDANIQYLGKSSTTSISNSIGHGGDSHMISDDDIMRHIQEHRQKKEAQQAHEQQNAVVEVPDHLKT
jgi:hypothetical protein